LVDIVVTDENLHAATGARICTFRVAMVPAVRTNFDF
jgi:hypothetical protein